MVRSNVAGMVDRHFQKVILGGRQLHRDVADRHLSAAENGLVT